ncbi:major facilitator superfamily domain-containing protein [Xylariaceae sp. FL1272]|nr:major facilitator superfamily domain-containing protein [Xylariaceae sp. FL1272]
MSETEKGPAPERDEPPSQQHQEELKEGGYGWVVVTAVFFLNAHTWGLNSFIASPMATWLVGWRHGGTRRTIFLGVIFETAGFIVSSFAYKLWHIILTQGVLFGLGLGLAFVASSACTPQWFRKRRSFATAITTAGTGFGGLLYSLATNAMIKNIGLSWTFRTLGIICFVVNGIASYFIRDRNAAVGSVIVALDWRLFKRPPFILFELYMIFSLIAYIILVFSIVAYCQAVGLSDTQSSLVGALFSLAQAIGRPAVGLSSDHAGRLNVAMLATLWAGVLCLLVWTFGARTYAGCVVFALLSGTTGGTLWATVSPICAEVVGLKMIPSALSVTWVALILPSTFAEAIGLSLRKSGSWGYLDVQLFTGFLYVGAFIFGWMLRAWKVWELEQAHLNKTDRERAIRDDGIASDRLQRHASRASTVKEQFLNLKGLWAVTKV